jgi:hypothetical protein
VFSFAQFRAGVATSSARIWQNLLVRITVNIPAALYRELKSRAAREKRSVKESILRTIGAKLPAKAKRSKRVAFPLIPSKVPGTLDIDNAKIYDLISLPNGLRVFDLAPQSLKLITRECAPWKPIRNDGIPASLHSLRRVP